VEERGPLSKTVAETGLQWHVGFVAYPDRVGVSVSNSVVTAIHEEPGWPVLLVEHLDVLGRVLQEVARRLPEDPDTLLTAEQLAELFQLSASAVTGLVYRVCRSRG